MRLGRIFAVVAAMVIACAVLVAPAANAMPSEPSANTASGNAAARGCPGWTNAVAGYGKWVKATGCSFTGDNYYYMEWTIPPGSNGRICVQGKGWTWNATKRKNVASWTSLGCGTGTYTPQRVPWCKGAPNPCIAPVTVRAKVQPGFLGGAYSFR